MGTPSSQPNPYREATKFPEIEGSWGGEGLLLELLEGTDSEAAVAHVGVRGTLSLRLGGPRTAGDERIYLGPRSLLLGPFPGPSCPHPHSGHPSSCTKVAVVPVLPTPGARVGSLLPVLPPASAPILDNLVHSYSWIAQLCVCVCVCFGGGGGFGWSGSGRGLGRARGKMEDSISYPLPQLQATEAWEGGCLAEQPQGGSLKAIQFSCWGTARQGRGLGGDLGFPMYSCVYSGVFSVWYPLWASMCV